MNGDLKLNFIPKLPALSFVLIGWPRFLPMAAKSKQKLKFDYEKSSLAFLIRFGKVVDQQPG